MIPHRPLVRKEGHEEVMMDEQWTRTPDGLRFAHRARLHPDPGFTPTLFVSGAFQTMDSWTRFERAFAPRTTVLLVDPPGMGRSDLLRPSADVDYLADCLVQVLDERGIERANVVAASYGTPSAYRLAVRHPERVDRIALAGTMRSLPAHMVSRIAHSVGLARARERERLADAAVAALMCHDRRREVARRDATARVLHSGIVRMTDAELDKYAANTQRLLQHVALDLSQAIRGPEALVFTGEHDCFTPPHECRRLALPFERAWFTTVRHADHLLHLEQWPTVIELLLRFMDRTLSAHGIEGCNELEPMHACAMVA